MLTDGEQRWFDGWTGLHYVHLGSTPAGSHISHWWRQEGHLAKTVPIHQKSYQSKHVRALKKNGVNNAKF